MAKRERSRRRRELAAHDDDLTPVVDPSGARVGRLRDCDTGRAAELFRRLVAAEVVGIGYGCGGVFVDGNEALLGAIGARSVDLEIGVPLHALFGIDDAAIELLLGGQSREFDLTRLDGTHAHVRATGLRVGEADWLMLVIDLSERHAAERAVKHLALHDPTTGVPNRRLLMDRLEHALARASREGSLVALLFCDVDRFKEINDQYGHRAGDAVLQTTAHRLGSVSRQYDTVARVGGDEFVVLLENLADATDATMLAERARIAIKEPMELDDRAVQVTVSVGIAVTSRAQYDADLLLRRADDAMYIAKAQGRDQVVFHPEDLNDRTTRQ